MASAERSFLLGELEQRRERLHTAVHDGANPELVRLLSEVDSALGRMGAASFGTCEACQGKIEADRLLSDPLLRFCLECLSQDEQRALETDLALAGHIQRGLLPRADFSPAGWRVHYHYAPAGPVSGDYCDVLETNDGLLFLLGDVSGKGVAASMMMSHLHATFRSLADAHLPLDQMVGAANRLFCESTLANQYATLVVGRACRDGAVEFVSAGHLPLVHIQSGGACLNEATGIPLGMFCDARFPVHRLQLAPSDGLFLFTDGLSEAENPQGEPYGIHRVQDFAAHHNGSAPQRLVSEYLSDLSSFSAGAKQADDLTVLALQRAS